MRGFLRGDYGKAFQRPAFELLMAGHAAAIKRVGVPKVQKQLENSKQLLDRGLIKIAIEALIEKLSSVDWERMKIIRAETDIIFGHEFPLSRRRFDLLNLSYKSFIDNLNLSDSHFFGADMRMIDLRRVNLANAHLEGANLSQANMEDSKLEAAHLEGGDLTMAHLEGAVLSDAHLEGASLFMAHLEGANFKRSNIEHADLRNVITDNRTDFTSVVGCSRTFPDA
jgi:uncharacterized protein YjbI with pentapeptide repeats